MNHSFTTPTRRWRRTRCGFTLMEVMVTTVFVAIAIVGTMGGIRSISRAGAQAQTANLLQSLAQEKLEELKILQDPSDDGSSGDFSDQGYPNITWSVDIEATSVTNVDQVTMTATEGQTSQDLTVMLYVAPASTTTTSTSTGATS